VALSWVPDETDSGSPESEGEWGAPKPTHSELFVLNGDRTGLARIARVPGDFASPQWSPDGKRIAFVAEDRKDQSHIYMMNEDGSGVTALTSAVAEDSEPAWSPDGRLVAFTRRRPGETTSSVWVAPSTEGNPSRVAEGSALPSWSPKGPELAYVRHGGKEGRRGDLCVADRGGQVLVAARNASTYATPSWSPDGTRIAFMRESTSQAGASLCTVSPDGARVRQYTKPRPG
jgi:TolB protein